MRLPIRCNDSMCADAIEAFHVSVVDAKDWRLLQINATDTFTMLLNLSFFSAAVNELDRADFAPMVPSV